MSDILLLGGDFEEAAIRNRATDFGKPKTSICAATDENL